MGVLYNFYYDDGLHNVCVFLISYFRILVFFFFLVIVTCCRNPVECEGGF
jgi:hypothetical protein